ncbi:TraX family protein [Pseudomonas sp. CMR5c]|uniref:TraX family protein n=1 Tax=Pseudomonas TaxID=286 RepID=UPI00069D8BB9|nr:TraX family protein [Pseudomonas sp. CMR5c]AZC21218.1 TraX family protein [Pseudomonas sp. CMR5c]
MRDAMLTPAPLQRDGALDALKWLALLSMVLDHLRYVGLELDWLYVPGRLAFPWFCLAMAANLWRVGAARRPGQWSYLGWLLAFSGLSEIPYRLFVPEPDTLNVLPTLALGLLVARGWQRRSGLDLVLGVVALGLAVGFSRWLMFGAFGVLLPLALLLVLRRPWYFAVLPGVLCLAGNQWEVLFAAVRLGNPLAGWGLVACLLAPGLGMWLLRGMRGGGWVPAMRRWAYLLYPGHFFLLLGVRQVLEGVAP